MSQEQKTSFFDSIKSFVVASDDPPAEDKHGDPAPPVRPALAAAAPQAADPDLVQKIDERTMAQLQVPIEKVAGTYAEFVSSMDALSDAVPDMAARQNAVIKLMTKKKIPLSQVLSDLDACIGALEGEGRNFREASKDHLAKKIGGMKQEVDSLGATVSAKESQIAALQGEVAALRATKSTKETDIRSAESDAVLVQSRFSTIYESKHAAMSSQRKQISDLMNKGSA